MSTHQPAQIKPLSRLSQLEAVWMFAKRELLMQTHFRFAYLTGLTETVSSLIIYGMIASFGQAASEVQHLAGGYVTWVIGGLVLNLLLNTALAGPYQSLLTAYWNNRLEIILSSPLRLPVFMLGMSVSSYVDALVRIAIYLLGGTLLLGFVWPAAPALLAFLAVLVPALAACTGLGLLAASSMYTLDARGGQDPVRFAVGTISGVVAGVYFPLSVLPAWAQWLAHTIPHTYAIDGMRRALFSDEQIPLLPVHTYLPVAPLLADIVMLVLYAAIAVPLGWKLFGYGIQLARSDGRLSRWV